MLLSYIEQIFCVESGGFNRLSIFITKLKLRQFQIHYYECFLLSIQAHEKSLFLFIVSNPMGLKKSPSSSIFASKLVSVRTLFWIIKTTGIQNKKVEKKLKLIPEGFESLISFES